MLRIIATVSECRGDIGGTGKHESKVVANFPSVPHVKLRGEFEAK